MVILEKASFLSLIHFPKDGDIEYCGRTTENTAVNMEKNPQKKPGTEIFHFISCSSYCCIFICNIAHKHAKLESYLK